MPANTGDQTNISAVLADLSLAEGGETELALTAFNLIHPATVTFSTSTDQLTPARTKLVLDAQDNRATLTLTVANNMEVDGDRDASILVEYTDGLAFTGSRTLTITITDNDLYTICLLYTSPSPRDRQKSRMPSSA